MSENDTTGEIDRRTAPRGASATVPHEAIMQVLRGESRTPHDVLGAHPATVNGVDGVVVRTRAPRVVSMDLLVDGEVYAMQREYDALFACFVPGARLPMSYRLRALSVDHTAYEFDDPYRFLPTLGDIDLHLFGEGRHLRLWEKLGAHPQVIDGVAGTAFAVWAPNARRVSVIGTFNDWDGRAHPMRAMGASGVFELFVPGVEPGALYKYEIRTPAGGTRVKTDPFAFKLEQAPGYASIVQSTGEYAWRDDAWIQRRAIADPVREPMLVYEVHLASWRRGEDNRVLSYREIAPLLAEHVKSLGFTHVELLPVLEHPYGGSWGYQVGGYFAPTSRHGSPDDFRALVDALHAEGIGVLLDWVPAHFPKDDWALRRFDGTACYEHEDPRLGDHPEWGTHIFNYARHEVRNFLLANALYWIEEFHIDGIRVDAVASMLYLDYGREAGQWLRNRFGGRENLEAVSFLKQLNHAVHSLYPGVVTIAEESTTWPKVTHPIVEGGLGFTFKWNMGWMHDTLDYYKSDPFFRKGAHDKLTFAMMYEYSERFVNPLSHDEVVHMKGSLLRKMPGDEWQRLANLRTLLGYSITRPGKSLFFMGAELGPWSEWNHDASLEWQLLEDPRRQGLMRYLAAAGALYSSQSCFWRHDHDPTGYAWIDVADKAQSVLSYARYDGAAHAVVVLNLTPVPRDHYRLGAPVGGTYRLALNSDATEFGGSGYQIAESFEADGEPYHGFAQSMMLTLPPLSMLVLLPDPMPSNDVVLPLTDTTFEDIEAAVAVIEAATRVRRAPATPRTRKPRNPKPRLDAAAVAAVSVGLDANNDQAAKAAQEKDKKKQKVKQTRKDKVKEKEKLKANDKDKVKGKNKVKDKKAKAKSKKSDKSLKSDPEQQSEKPSKRAAGDGSSDTVTRTS